MTPNRSNNYQLPSWPPTALTRDLWNAVFLDIALRLAARENLEASFEELIEQGTQSSLDYIQVNIGPQIASLQQAIENAQDRIEEIIVDGTAPNSAKLGGELPAYYATAEGLALKANDADIETRARAVVAELTGNAPTALDTIYELAAAIGNDPNIRQTLLNAIAEKLNKTGGTLTGPLTVEVDNAFVRLKATNGRAYYIQSQASGRLRIFDETGNAEVFSIGADGDVSTKQLGDLNTRIEARAQAWRTDAINNIMPTIAAQGAGAVGTYAFLQYDAAGANPGDQVSGGSCRWSDRDIGSPVVGYGSWRTMGWSQGARNSTLFMRYA